MINENGGKLMEEIKVVDNENNELEEPKYTLTDISEAMRNISEDAFENLFKLNVETLYGIANFQKGYDSVVNMCDNNINTYQRFKNAVIELKETLEKKSEPTMEDSINRMVEAYKAMNREERLRLNVKLQQESDLQNSMDALGFTWNNFKNNLKKLSGN